MREMHKKSVIAKAAVDTTETGQRTVSGVGWCVRLAPRSEPTNRDVFAFWGDPSRLQKNAVGSRSAGRHLPHVVLPKKISFMARPLYSGLTA